MAESSHTLTIVIPALNEQDAIGATIERCLEAREHTFEINRGYGAAIQCGFAYSRGDLVAFLDADGTCDPLLFADFCRALDEEHADLVLGSRMGADSRMPMVRTIGNTLFAWLLGALSRRLVEDTASGMRVIRRSCLGDLYPLPEGLHFTPAMSARVLIETS